MTEHLTDVELRVFLAGGSSAEALLRADEHLELCESCRARAGALGEWSRELSSVHRALAPASDHLTDEEVQQYVAGRMARQAVERAREHVQQCEVCSTQVAELNTWAAQAAPRRNRIWLAAAAALLLAVAIPAALWLARSPGRRDGSVVAGLEHLSADEQARVNAALSGGAATLPASLRDLRVTREVLLGPNSASARFNVIEPVGTVVPSGQPTFTWQPLAGATGYVVSIFDERSRMVARSPEVGGTQWTPEQPLPREQTLVWQVAATRNGETVTEPAAPAPPARFRILSEAAASRLATLEASTRDAHLVLGLLYRDAGVVDAARAHLNQVSSADPHSAVARQALAQLDPLRD